MSVISQQQSEQYLAAGGTHCPICESPDIATFGDPSFTANAAYLDVKCNACKATWTDAYQLVAAEDVID